MTVSSYEQGKRKQEEVCAQTFLRWLSSQRGNEYELQRAEESQELRGRWDFVARAKGHKDWIALEVKGLVIPQSHRQFGSWSKFCESVTRELHAQGTIKGSFAIVTDVQWQFDQKQSKLLAKAFIGALTAVTSSMSSDAQVDLGPMIAERFSEWPTKPPIINQKLWNEQHICEIVHSPEKFVLVKLDNIGCSVEVGAVVSQGFWVEPTLTQAVLAIFDPQDGRDAKPNEQLREALDKGASETVLILDSHIHWKPSVVAQALRNIDHTLMSAINAVFLVSNTNERVKRLWPL